jgi:hypothetical protein
VGVRARSVPDARLRRHDRLPADQAALLRDPPGHQPDRRRARGPRHVRLAHAAPTRGAGRPALRRRHAAAPAAGRRDRAG